MTNDIPLLASDIFPRQERYRSLSSPGRTRAFKEWIARRSLWNGNKDHGWHPFKWPSGSPVHLVLGQDWQPCAFAAGTRKKLLAQKTIEGGPPPVTLTRVVVNPDSLAGALFPGWTRAYSDRATVALARSPNPLCTVK